MSDPLIETENPNDTATRNPGDPTVSLNPDGTPANAPTEYVATAPVNPEPSLQSDPAHVPSPYQPPEATEEQVETAKLREAAIQAENRWRPGDKTDKTPRVDPGLVVTPSPEPAPAPQPVWDPATQTWR
jgi:hypothetical protein